MNRREILLSLISLVEEIFHSTAMTDVEFCDVVAKAIFDLKHCTKFIDGAEPSFFENSYVLVVFDGKDDKNVQ